MCLALLVTAGQANASLLLLRVFLFSQKVKSLDLVISPFVP
jgi:hypothetical protein